MNLNHHQDRILEHLGDPPDLTKLDDWRLWDAEQREIIRVLRPELERMVLTGAEMAVNLMPVGVDWALAAREASDWAGRYSYGLVSGITDTTRESLRRKVGQWIDTPGLTIGDLKRDLAPIFGDMRAQMIGITETTRAYAEGERIIAGRVRGEGIPLTHYWNTSGDARVCPVCAPRDRLPENEWPTPEWPPLHPRCRCWISTRWDRVGAGVPAEPGRPLSELELEMGSQVAEARVAYEAAMESGSSREAAAIKEYYELMLQELENERTMNDALWEHMAMAPGEADDRAWNQVASMLDGEGQRLYRKYTHEGIQFEVIERRGAQDSGYMHVGGQLVQVKQGRFSRRQAQRLEGELWAQAKIELNEDVGQFLTQNGYRVGDIAAANYEQRLKLLAEMGQKELLRTGRGRVSRIDDVPENARERVVTDLGYDRAATCASVAQDPLNLPTLDAWGRMELAERIRATRLAGLPEPDWA